MNNKLVFLNYNAHAHISHTYVYIKMLESLNYVYIEILDKMKNHSTFVYEYIVQFYEDINYY